MKYIGLTDDPNRRRQDHGNPYDWWECSFTSEDEARAWEKDMLSNPDHTGIPGGEGWRFGYIYTITPSTNQ
jgi:hypothetical protein